MLRVLRNVFLGFVVLAAAFAIFVMLQSSELRVARSQRIDAPAATVFEQVHDFHKWEAWSPWEKIDPQMKKTFEGPSSGKDASYAWVGNEHVGEGKMTILESKPNELIRIRLDFLKPWPSTSEVEFTFKPEGPATEATWSMAAKKSFPMKAAGVLLDLDKKLGEDFEKGLEGLKAAAEAGKPK